ncbi:MAG: hypothetical protein F6J90_04085 [Moorea sp. SIOASIH]|uniref:hypothetical protein n=1 Tax=Moorena sp. SIOASIH TaxID=2607817 RepID=UPI0013BDDAB1|nr:hypothetical protein [Moorena sp. SIOASIH]NEO35535.1 hypothetical protein [Moorena sp. SIOASIH]
MAPTSFKIGFFWQTSKTGDSQQKAVGMLWAITPNSSKHSAVSRQPSAVSRQPSAFS